MNDDTKDFIAEHNEDDNAEPAQRLGQIEKSIIAALEKAARGGRDTLGFMSLHSMVEGHKGSIANALKSLKKKQLVIETNDLFDATGKSKFYALAPQNES